MPRRTALFAPGDDREKCEKAATTGADVVIFDLEDGVGADRKDHARETVADLLGTVETDSEVCVRVNANPDERERDMEAVFGEAASDEVATEAASDDVEPDGSIPDSLMFPKVGSVGDILAIAESLDGHGHSLPILAIVESAAGVLNGQAIAAAEPTDALILGAQDLAADVGSDPAEPGGLTTLAREHVLLAARASGVDAIDTHYPTYDDYEGLGEAARRAAVLGYDGKLAIHPRQVDVIHEAFVPAPDRIDWAEHVIEAYADAESGVCVVDGDMIDAPQVRQAERILDRADPDDREN